MLGFYVKKLISFKGYLATPQSLHSLVNHDNSSTDCTGELTIWKGSDQPDWSRFLHLPQNSIVFLHFYLVVLTPNQELKKINNVTEFKIKVFSSKYLVIPIAIEIDNSQSRDCISHHSPKQLSPVRVQQSHRTIATYNRHLHRQPAQPSNRYAVGTVPHLRFKRNFQKLHSKCFMKFYFLPLCKKGLCCLQLNKPLREWKCRRGAHPSRRLQGDQCTKQSPKIENK